MNNLKYLTKKDLEEVRKQTEYTNRYYKDRWEYLSEFIEEIKKMDSIEKTLELGPFRTPLIVGGDIMDITDSNLNYYPIKIGDFFKLNAKEVPYPFEDKKYDLIIASQVLEHCGIYGEQKQIFEEFKRISKKAIISLPYEWNAPSERDHHMITKSVINNWFNNYQPTSEIIKGEKTKRILLTYDFE